MWGGRDITSNLNGLARPTNSACRLDVNFPVSPHVPRIIDPVNNRNQYLCVCIDIIVMQKFTKSTVVRDESY